MIDGLEGKYVMAVGEEQELCHKYILFLLVSGADAG